MTKMDEGVWVQLATRIPKELHRRLKLHSVQTDTSVMEFAVTALEEKLAKIAKTGGTKRVARGE